MLPLFLMLTYYFASGCLIIVGPSSSQFDPNLHGSPCSNVSISHEVGGGQAREKEGGHNQKWSPRSFLTFCFYPESDKGKDGRGRNRHVSSPDGVFLQHTEAEQRISARHCLITLFFQILTQRTKQSTVQIKFLPKKISLAASQISYQV